MNYGVARIIHEAWFGRWQGSRGKVVLLMTDMVRVSITKEIDCLVAQIG
jgi:hypothetical protein